MTTYPSNVRWLGYETKRGSQTRNRSRGTGGVRNPAGGGIISVGCAAAAWGLFQLALRLLS